MYVTVTVTRGSVCLLPWKMQETQADWTFTKLLECILSSSLGHLDELPGMETEVVCKLSKEINSPERVEVPLGFVIEPCCKENGNFIRYLSTKEEALEFRKCKEEFIYVCGSSVIPEDSQLQCAFEVDINCESPISNHYYSARLKLPPVCYVCGVLSPLVPISPERKRLCQSIHPVCEDCKASGKTERTRGEKLVGQKRKK